MSPSLSSLIPNAADVLALEVEELAGVLLVHLNSAGSAIVQHGLISPQNFFLAFNSQRPHEYGNRQAEVGRALTEAWSCLESLGFLIKDPEQPAPHFFVSRRGKRITSIIDFESYRKANLLPRGHLHPFIEGEIYSAFLRGKYDTAIFEAFREVEVAVREAGKFSPQSYGTDLMRDAFRPAAKNNKPVDPGPLTDTKIPIPEQEAISNLFSGAIGFYKNPQSHRHIPTDPEDAAEVIVFASQLLRIVDRLKPQ